MKGLRLHALVVAGLSFVACTTGGGSRGGSGPSIDPQTKVAEMDGQPITWADVQADKDVGSQLKQAEVKALNDLHQARQQALEQLITKRLLTDEAKAKGKTFEQWVETDFRATVPDPTDDKVKAFYQEHKSQMPPNASFEQIRPQIVEYMKKQDMRQALSARLEELKAQHGVKVALPAPEVPRVDVEAKGPSEGPGDARVTIVEFSDFQCPYCSRAVPTIQKLMGEYKGKVRLVFRHFPLDMHPDAPKAAEAGACAADQGKFWQMHDKMFGNQQKLSVGDLKSYAKDLGLDTKRFDQCLDSGEKKTLVEDDLRAGSAAGVNGTPAFFINGIFINGAVPYEQLKSTVDRELSRKG